MSSFQNKQIVSSNCNELLVNSDGSINVVQSATGGILPIHKPGEFTNIDSSGFTVINTYPLVSPNDFYLKQIIVSLIGIAAHFRVQINDGSVTTVFREYHLNTQEPSFVDVLEYERKVTYAAGASIFVDAKILAIGHSGRAVAHIIGR